MIPCGHDWFHDSSSSLNQHFCILKKFPRCCVHEDGTDGWKENGQRKCKGKEMPSLPLRDMQRAMKAQQTHVIARLIDRLFFFHYLEATVIYLAILLLQSHVNIAHVAGPALYSPPAGCVTVLRVCAWHLEVDSYRWNNNEIMSRGGCGCIFVWKTQKQYSRQTSTVWCGGWFNLQRRTAER